MRGKACISPPASHGTWHRSTGVAKNARMGSWVLLSSGKPWQQQLAVRLCRTQPLLVYHSLSALQQLVRCSSSSCCQGLTMTPSGPQCMALLSGCTEQNRQMSCAHAASIASWKGNACLSGTQMGSKRKSHLQVHAHRSAPGAAMWKCTFAASAVERYLCARVY